MVEPKNPFGVRVRKLPKQRKRDDIEKCIRDEFKRMELEPKEVKVREKNQERQACVHFSDPEDVLRALKFKTIQIGETQHKLTQCCAQNEPKGQKSTAPSTFAKEEPSTCPETDSDVVSDRASSRCPSTETGTSTTSSRHSKSNGDDGSSMTKQTFTGTKVKETVVPEENLVVKNDRKGKSRKEKKGKRVKKREQRDDNAISKEGDSPDHLHLPESGFRNLISPDLPDMKYSNDLGGDKDMNDKPHGGDLANGANVEDILLENFSNKLSKDNQKRRNGKETTRPSDEKQVIKSRENRSIPEIKLPALGEMHLNIQETPPIELAGDDLTMLLPKIDCPTVAPENVADEEPGKVKRPKKKRGCKHKPGKCENKKSH